MLGNEGDTLQGVRKSALCVFAYLPGCGSDGMLAGTLVQTSGADRGADFQFTYDAAYLASNNAFPLDPVSLEFLGDVGSSDNIYWPANGLLEFGALRDATPDAWGRRATEALLQASLNNLSEVDYLLAAGGDRVGALDVREQKIAPHCATACHSGELPDLLETAAAVEKGIKVSPHNHNLLRAMRCAGGARPKASVRDEDGALWLAKLPSINDKYDVATAEFCAMKLAYHCGLTVPEVQRTFAVGQPIMWVRRFDRYWSRHDESLADGSLHDTRPSIGAREYRSPFISALTLLGCSEFESPYKSYSDLVKAIRQYVHPSYIDKDCEELFKRMVFNILINNDDDHLRNHGFIYDFRIQGWRLSPLYDVVPRPSFSYERRLHLSIGAEGKLATLNNALSDCSDFVPKREIAIKIMVDLWREVSQWRRVFETYGATEELIVQMSSAFRSLDEVAGNPLALELLD